VTEKKLNLFEFASRAMAEPGTGTTKVMRREMVHADPLGIVLYECPNNVRRDSATQFGSIFPDSSKYQTFSHSGPPPILVLPELDSRTKSLHLPMKEDVIVHEYNDMLRLLAHADSGLQYVLESGDR
jgi:hypothetical protein